MHIDILYFLYSGHRHTNEDIPLDEYMYVLIRKENICVVLHSSDALYTLSLGIQTLFLRSSESWRLASVISSECSALKSSSCSLFAKIRLYRRFVAGFLILTLLSRYYYILLTWCEDALLRCVAIRSGRRVVKCVCVSAAGPGSRKPASAFTFI